MAKAIMIQGTMSNAGKSLIAACLCRIFREDGYRTAPFKAQNMALNSCVTKEGLEMGRAQAVQAEAAGIEPSVLMNPILLKPTTDMGSQVIINGRPFGNLPAMEYIRRRQEFRPYVEEAYRELSRQYDLIVIEGAGSPAEINLRDNDFVNMGMAEIADAPVLLVGDIDRGGVFAQLYGTIALLREEEQKRIAGVLINKFRGDISILKPGLSMLEERIQRPVLGVVPYMDVHIEDEDSLSGQLAVRDRQEGLDLAVIRLPRISNFTDFQAFTLEESAHVRYVTDIRELGSPDAVLIPGTKSTIRDLIWLRESGLEGAIKKLHKRGTMVFGICGGYQMLGRRIEDPEGAEWKGGADGMGLLPEVTVFKKEKTMKRASGKASMYLKGSDIPALSDCLVEGYEIHMGRTDESKEEETGGGYVLGTYLHGVFDHESFRHAFLHLLADQKGICLTDTGKTYREYKEEQYDMLARQLREALDLPALRRIIGIPDPKPHEP